MTVTPYDIGTFHVSSESGQPDYLVDMAFLDDGWRKPRPVCGCLDSFAKGFRICKHVKAVAMMIYGIPDGFREVEVADFEQCLKECADYYRDSYSGCSVYFFRHNNQQFAVVKGPPEKAWVAPSLLAVVAQEKARLVI